MDKGTYGTTTMPAGGTPTDSDTFSGSLFSIDPLVYGDMMFSLGYASAVASSGIGQQTFESSLNSGPSSTTLGQGRPGPGERLLDPPPLYDDGGRGTTSNPDGSATWNNPPRGFE